MVEETVKIRWEYEDRIEKSITEGMFEISEIVDGVRMYPYVEVGFGRYYLESR